MSSFTSPADPNVWYADTLDRLAQIPSNTKNIYLFVSTAASRTSCELR